MHDAWNIDDIRLLIFEHLEHDDLINLAQTCRALFTPVTDKLWKNIPSFSPFVACLPRDSRRRPLQLEDLERLDLYGSKVHYVCMEKTIDNPIKLPLQFKRSNKKKQAPEIQANKSWNDLWTEISNLRPATSKFLPNLRRIRVSHVHEETLVPLIGVSNANLTYVYIKFLQYRQPESVVQRILSRFEDAPRLDFLCVLDGDGQSGLVSAKLIEAAPLKHLRLLPRVLRTRYGTENFRKTAIRHEILKKSTIEHLSINLTRDWYSPEIEALEGKYLPALTTLWLNLSLFQSEACGDESCTRKNDHSWTCDSDASLPSWRANFLQKSECARQPPTVFFDGLDNPKLHLLNIQFPIGATGQMFLDIVSAAQRNCRLSQLTELALAGGGWKPHCSECGQYPEPSIQPEDLRQAMKMLLPLPHLRTLRLSVAPNFLDIMDMELYKDIAEGLPSLRTLLLGHASFTTNTLFHGETFREHVPLQNLAAFCSLLPNLVEVYVGTLDVSTIEDHSHLVHLEWACYGIRSLRVSHWKREREGVLVRLGADVVKKRVESCLQVWFPLSDIAETIVSLPSYD